jgi:hypothetical protein
MRRSEFYDHNVPMADRTMLCDCGHPCNEHPFDMGNGRDRIAFVCLHPGCPCRNFGVSDPGERPE